VKKWTVAKGEEAMSGEHKPKIGEGALRAAGRQGLKELAQALPATKDSMQIVEEPGQIGNPTSYEVSKQTGSVERSIDLEPDMEP
jgi:hypothetical protein